MGFVEDKDQDQVIMDYNYFINKFTAIPEEDWAQGDYVDRAGRCCALGHCGVRNDNEFQARLIEAHTLQSIAPAIVEVNDDTLDNDGYGDSPKSRVIAYLKELQIASKK